MVAQTIPAPIGGWNKRDALDLMPPQDAVTLDNWFPGNGRVAVRKGYTQHATGLGSSNVDTLAEYSKGTTKKLLAGANGNIYDATTSSISSLKSGLSANRWETVNFNGQMGWVNGTDTPLVYDGSSFANMTVSGTGLTVTNLRGIMVHQSHTFFWENNSQDFWYSAVNTLGGTITKFPLSRVGAFGGNLVCAGSWNVAGGSEDWVGGGIGNDLAVFVMSSGDTIVYEGDNPASNWNLVGVYRIPEPLDIRAIAKVGGDLVIATKGGIISMATVSQSGQLEQRGVISDKINPALIEKSGLTDPGWQLEYHPTYSQGRMLLLNLPNSTVDFDQYVMNADTLSWARFKDLNARAWGRYDDNLYFGTTDGKVMKFDDGNADISTDISGDAETAYNYFESRGVLKRCAALRPVLASDGTITVSIAPQFDFQRRGIPAADVSLIEAGDTWEEITDDWEDWDTDWDDSIQSVVAKWLASTGAGYAIGARFRVTTSDDLEWHSLTYQLEPGQGIF